eukprot:140571_1
MNSLRPSLSKAVKQFATRRFASSRAYKPKTIDFTNLEQKKWNVKKDWFSDPATYPIFVIMGIALTFMTGAAANALIRYQDVTLDPRKRNSKLQTWGTEGYTSNLSKVIAWNAYGKEGLGIDHETWLKEKEAAAGKKP